MPVLLLALAACIGENDHSERIVVTTPAEVLDTLADSFPLAVVVRRVVAGEDPTFVGNSAICEPSSTDVTVEVVRSGIGNCVEPDAYLVTLEHWLDATTCTTGLGALEDATEPIEGAPEVRIEDGLFCTFEGGGSSSLEVDTSF